MNLLKHIPGIKKWAHKYVENNKERLENIDKQIAALHNQDPKTFISVVLIELSCRICSALEVFFILLVLFPSVNYLNCILIISFTTLFANIFVFYAFTTWRT